MVITARLWVGASTILLFAPPSHATGVRSTVLHLRDRMERLALHHEGHPPFGAVPNIRVLAFNLPADRGIVFARLNEIWGHEHTSDLEPTGLRIAQLPLTVFYITDGTVDGTFSVHRIPESPDRASITRFGRTRIAGTGAQINFVPSLERLLAGEQLEEAHRRLLFEELQRLTNW